MGLENIILPLLDFGFSLEMFLQDEHSFPVMDFELDDHFLLQGIYTHIIIGGNEDVGKAGFKLKLKVH